MSTEQAEDVLQQVLKHPELLSLVYQPIVDLERAELVGYEALARLPGSQGPQTWFELAGTRGVSVDLDMIVLERVVEQVASVPRGRFLSVNLSLKAIADPRTAQLVARAGAAASRLVLELTDPVTPGDVSTLRAAVQPLREHGVQIAVHVNSSDHALNALSQLRPDVVKMRSSVSAESPEDGVVELSESIERYGRELGAAVVVTVLEAAGQLKAVSGAKASLAQGYLLGRPDVVLTELSPAVTDMLRTGPERRTAPLARRAQRTPDTSVPGSAAVSPHVIGVFGSDSLAQVLEGLAAK